MNYAGLIRELAKAGGIPKVVARLRFTGCCNLRRRTTPSGSTYHRLDTHVLFKALQNYVEPKIRLEESRFDSLRSRKGAPSESGMGAKKLDRDIDKQEDLISELLDFEEKVRRVANLHLVPDLNDGVVLNIAPLHELVPWNEAKKYWEELLEGKYEWSSIGKQLREKGLAK